MIKGRFKGNRTRNKFIVLTHQKKLIETHYDYLKCNIDWRKNILICEGWLRPNVVTDNYKVRIEYVVGKEPKTTVLIPDIAGSKHIHMYNDHSLCLHYPPDLAWDEKIKIYQYTIPWISEWIIYYELFLINGGVWEGRESPVHIKESEKNVNIDN